LVTSAREPDLPLERSAPAKSEQIPDDTDAAAGTQERRLARIPFYPLLLAAYPVLLLYSDNVIDVPARDVIIPLLVAVGATALVFVILTALAKDPRRAAIVTAAVILPFMGFGVLAELVAPIWPYEPIVRAYLMVVAIWVVVVALSVYVALKLNSRLGGITEALNIVSIVLLGLALLPIAAFAMSSPEGDGSGEPQPEAAILAPAVLSEDLDRRDIYHLVFDRYGSDRALELGRGLDNSGFTGWLRAQGFDVVQDSRANHERTALSLSSVHSMDLLEDLATEMGPDNLNLDPLYRRIRESRAASILQDNGYRYYHLGSWFSPTATSDIADVSDEVEYVISFNSTMVDRSAINGVGAIVGAVTSMSPHGSIERQAEVTERQLERIEEIASEPGPKYVFAHVLIPHEPYLFLGDGTFDPDSASFETQLVYANSRIRSLVTDLLDVPADEQPIIVLQADEGPYPDDYAGERDQFDWDAASPDDLITKFSVLNAMYLPGSGGLEPLPEGLSLVNTYPELLRRYLDEPVENLPDRTYALRDGRPYDRVDVTERLDEALKASPSSD
jgi:hypothetical protein